MPAALALVYFGRWIEEIVVPTLKGGNFDQLYDLHHVSYLHLTMTFIAISFVWLAAIVIGSANKNEKRPVEDIKPV